MSKKAHYTSSLLLLILACCLVGLNLSENSRGNHDASDAGEADVSRRVTGDLAAINPQRARIAIDAQNASTNVDSFAGSGIIQQPFTVNGLSPLANASLGFNPDTVDRINERICNARFKAVQLLVENIKRLDDGQNEKMIAHYKYQANLDAGLKIKNELIKDINTITAGSFDKEIEQMLGGNISFLYCGTVNFEFRIFADEASNGEKHSIEIIGQTMDGHIVVPRYECDLNSFTRSTLVEFDLAK